MSCNPKDWLDFSSYRYCKLHKSKFNLTSFCPSFPMETSKTTKSEVSENFTNNSRTITNKSRRVIVERFHCYRIKFNAEVAWDHLFQYEEFSLNNNVKFKRIDYEEAIVKVFRKSILITLRSNQEIKGLPVREAKAKSDLLIQSVLKKLPSAIKVKDSNVASIHNAFVNHPYGNYDLNVKVNGETRLITDHSKGKLEFEAVNTQFAISDSEAIEKDNISLIDKGLSREFLAQAINYLIEDRKFWAEHQRSHVEAIQTLSSSVKDLKDQVISLSHTKSGRKVSDTNSTLFPSALIKSKDSEEKRLKMIKVRAYLRQYGWGESIWE